MVVTDRLTDKPDYIEPTLSVSKKKIMMTNKNRTLCNYATIKKDNTLLINQRRSKKLLG